MQTEADIHQVDSPAGLNRAQPHALRINVGCGAKPMPGWLNFDNSLTVRLARVPGLLRLLFHFGLASRATLEFGRMIIANNIVWADAARRIPVPDAAAEVVYSSHMLTYLDRADARRFLAEVRRVLASGGTLRIAVADLSLYARRYVNEKGDADVFLAGLLLADEKPRGTLAALRRRIVGYRFNRWMYDPASLSRLLAECGFRDIVELSSGATRIAEPGGLNLRERIEDSFYMEARRS